MLERFEQFSYAVSALYRYLQKIERDEMIKQGYRGSFAQYLVALSRRPEGRTATQLCEICDKDKAAVSRAVSDMEEKGLIVRESARGDSMYRARLLLTEEGRRAADFVCERASRAVMAAGRGLSEENRKIFYASMEIIAGNLANISKEGIPQE